MSRAPDMQAGDPPGKRPEAAATDPGHAPHGGGAHSGINPLAQAATNRRTTMHRRSMLAAGTTLLAGAAQAQTTPPAGVNTTQAAGVPPALPYKAHSIATPDGVTVKAYEYGNPAGPAILFIHGYMQAGLSWDRQVQDPAMLREFRMVTYDLRGHGMSDKPVGDAFYKPGKVWGDEVHALIRGIGLNRPVLVGWSYGGRLLGDYLIEHGHAGIAGLNYVGAVSSGADPSRFGTGGRHTSPTAAGSEDPITAIRGTIAFLRACFERQPSTEEFEAILAFNMMVPRHARLSMQGRPANFDAQLRALNIPVLVTHGAKRPADRCQHGTLHRRDRAGRPAVGL